jgi:hypothetical protein
VHKVVSKQVDVSAAELGLLEDTVCVQAAFSTDAYLQIKLLDAYLAGMLLTPEAGA